MTFTQAGRPSAAQGAAYSGEAATSARPRELTAEDFALMTGNLRSDTASAGPGRAPTMVPPSAGASAGAAGTISGQKVTALWTNSANGNSYIYLETAGWKRLSSTTDSGSSNLTLLGASARQTGSAPSVVDDATGLVTALYVW